MQNTHQIETWIRALSLRPPMYAEASSSLIELK
jgi:hypothetical protein